MSFERVSDSKIRGDSLDAFVQASMTLYKNQLAIRNAEDENRFATLVLEQDLSVEDQLAYRKEQLKRVTDDKAERSRIQGEISSLKARAEQKKFSEEYSGELVKHEAGLQSVDSVLKWLNDTRDQTTNETVLAAIDKEIVSKTTEKFNLAKSLIDNQTKFALSDKSDQVLDTQIGRITTEKNKALLAGNDELASTYDLHLQALRQAKTVNSITKDVQNMAVVTATGASSATKLLDSYNSKISSSGTSAPVTVNGVTYANEQAFWTHARDTYIADSSDNGFFDRFKNEQSDSIKVKSIQNTLTKEDLASSAQAFSSLTSRPELANLLPKIETAKVGVLQTGADLISKKILNSYEVNYDINSAVTALNNLKTVGVNVDDAYSRILTAGAQIKNAQVSGILSQAGNLMQADQTLTPELAVQQAIKQGQGSVVTPEVAATKTAGDIATESAKASITKTATEPKATTVQPTAPSAPATPTPKPAVPQATTAPKPTYVINQQLDFGAKNPQVKDLQKFLNSQGFTVASSGEGSAGNETDYFGPLTQAALKKFQSAQGIVSSGDAATTGYGRLGPQTISKIQSLINT